MNKLYENFTSKRNIIAFVFTVILIFTATQILPQIDFSKVELSKSILLYKHYIYYIFSILSLIFLFSVAMMALAELQSLYDEGHIFQKEYMFDRGAFGKFYYLRVFLFILFLLVIACFTEALIFEVFWHNLLKAWINLSLFFSLKSSRFLFLCEESECFVERDGVHIKWSFD